MTRRDGGNAMPSPRPFRNPGRRFIPARQRSLDWGATKLDRNGLGFFVGMLSLIVGLVALLNLFAQPGLAGKLIAGVALALASALTVRCFGGRR